MLLLLLLYIKKKQSKKKKMSTNTNRQESHRIYLQLFTPQSNAASTTQPQQLHRHDSHPIHPPNYPMTNPGAPYRFSSSPSTNLSSVDSSHSLSSSLSSVHPASGPHSSPSAAVSNTSYSKQPTYKKRFMQQPSTITTSAAVRLTDRALARDVTALLRGKFGLPQLSLDHPNHHNQQQREMNSPQKGERGLSSSFGQSLARRLSPSSINKQQQLLLQQRSTSGSGNNFSGGFRKNSSNNSYEEQSPPMPPIVMDALVLAGTLEGPPKGYVEFEHEEEFWCL